MKLVGVTSRFSVRNTSTLSKQLLQQAFQFCAIVSCAFVHNTRKTVKIMSLITIIIIILVIITIIIIILVIITIIIIILVIITIIIIIIIVEL